MFVWIASYPKSGNTLTRSLLTSYFFSHDGIFDFKLLKNIKQFPNNHLFLKHGIDVNDEKEVIRNYIKIQNSINDKNSIQFLKTHSYLFNIENNPFTDLNNSLGVIYLVRDPRNIIISAANHNSTTHRNSADDMISGKPLRKSKTDIWTYTGTWSGNYNSWKSFKSVNRYLLIKYEDFIADKEKIFFKILNFIHKLKKIELVLDKKKFQKCLDTTSFYQMQNMENKLGFEESLKNKNTGKKNKFFYLGPKNDWKKMLDVSLKKEIEDKFEKEMKELDYL
tara:strand:+ start:435 stop:1271 length:837 start_codon:yes stop_codon:yes gene_type:complete